MDTTLSSDVSFSLSYAVDVFPFKVWLVEWIKNESSVVIVVDIAKDFLLHQDESNLLFHDIYQQNTQDNNVIWEDDSRREIDN